MPFPHPQPSAIWLAHRARIRKLEEQQELVRAERLRVARDLHDTLSHSFTGVIMQVEATRRMLQKGQRDPETHLAWAGRMAREGLNEARRAVYALKSGNGVGCSASVCWHWRERPRRLTRHCARR